LVLKVHKDEPPLIRLHAASRLREDLLLLRQRRRHQLAHGLDEGTRLLQRIHLIFRVLDLHGKGLQLVGEVFVLALALAGQHLEIPPRLLQLLVARHDLPQHLLQLCLEVASLPHQSIQAGGEGSLRRR